jgi:vitamin B12 transporter
MEDDAQGGAFGLPARARVEFRRGFSFFSRSGSNRLTGSRMSDRSSAAPFSSHRRPPGRTAARWARPSNRGHAFALASCASLLLAGTLNAQLPSVPDPDTVPRFVVPEVTVTVTRSESPRDALPQTIDVITAADMERTPADELAELLKKLAGVDVLQYPGLLSGVGIRGFRPQVNGINQRTMILVNGRPAGVTNLSLIPIESIERIEVLKGPASSLYGSSAMGGAINVVTRRSAGALGGRVSGAYGSWNTAELRGHAGGALTPSIDFDLGVAYFERGSDVRIGGGSLFRDMLGGETVRRTTDGVGSPVVDSGAGEVRPFTKYGTRSGNFRLGYLLGSDVRVDVRAEHLGADRVQGPGDIHLLYDNRTLKNLGRNSGEVSMRAAVGPHDLTARVFASGEDSDFFNVADAAPGQAQYISYRSLARWLGAQFQDVARFGAHTLTAGVDVNSARSASERFEGQGQRGTPWEPDYQIRSLAGFAQGQFTFLADRVVATLGARLDNVIFEVLETHLLPTQIPDRESTFVFNPSAGLQYRTDSGFRVRTTLGRGFVSPHAFQVAGRSERPIGPDRRTIDLTRGNPGLTAENSVTWDAGVGFLDGRRGVDLDVTYFRTDVRDRITTLRTTPAGLELTAAGDTIRSITSYVNADDAELRGLEARASYDLGTLADNRFALRAFANGTRILRAEEITGGEARRIQNVADLSLGYGIEWDDLRRFGARLTGRYVGERLDTDWSDWTNPAQVAFPAFMTLDLAGDYRVTDRYRLGVQVTNLTDEHYYEIRGFPLPGRSTRLSVSATF